ncbi:MAG: hypothetical protein HXX12_03115 [Geothrix sp.]|uniref:hypothetical protein n=1 Tax=Geothrix sp. TaxID=1962974 RepID=UPI0017FBE96F|nr:hypothetical protein [Geothrix sp.]NWJ39948.1 hypothetical protein [Geothrix sp.]WIL22040.1 MAG: hypothetical protein QOZ81_001327 [Geothrix sp.]
MLDLLLIPAALLLAFALGAVRRGEHRLHGHLMTAAFTFIGLRVLLHPRALRPQHFALWLATLGLAGTTLLLGRKALAWREARSTQTVYPRVHRTMGALTLIGLALTTLVWLLRNRT